MAPRGALLRSGEWKAFVREEDRKKREGIRQAMVRRLDDAAALELIGLCKEGGLEEQSAAMELLSVRAREPGRPLPQDVISKWLDAAVGLAQRHYPRHPAGHMAVRALLERDQGQADGVLTKGIKLKGLTEKELVSLARDLRWLNTPGAVARLQKIAERRDSAGAEAKRVLEAVSMPSTETLDALVTQWKRHRQRDALNRLYYAYISKLPEGTPMSDLLKLLGKPSRRLGLSRWYEVRGACLYLEEDMEGRLIGWKLT
jgi:hypothetical protein